MAQAVTAEVECAYPELVRNVDLARQLSVTSQTSLPYISTLPPWAREVLGPVIEYTLELIGILIRWFLYPLWRLLPSWLRWLFAVIAVLFGSLLVLVVTLLWKYWLVSVAFGRWLARWTAVAVCVRGVMWVVGGVGEGMRKHWRLLVTSGALVLFWWWTTPDGFDEDDGDGPGVPVGIQFVLSPK